MIMIGKGHLKRDNGGLIEDCDPAFFSEWLGKTQKIQLFLFSVL